MNFTESGSCLLSFFNLRPHCTSRLTEKRQKTAIIVFIFLILLSFSFLKLLTKFIDLPFYFTKHCNFLLSICENTWIYAPYTILYDWQKDLDFESFCDISLLYRQINYSALIVC
jgi:hypothetical protein